jgi:hypothetical protein
MAKQTINVGITANDRTGDPLRIAFQKTNANFTELYNTVDGIVVPENLSELTNDVGFVTANSIPTDISELTDIQGLLGQGGGDVNLTVTIPGDPYKGFGARYGRVYSNSSNDELTVSKLVIFKETAATNSTIDSRGGQDDDFTVSGLDNSDVVAMFVLYGDTNGEKSLETLKTFARASIDTVILAGGVEGNLNTIDDMQTAFYANITTLASAAGGLAPNFEFFIADNSFSVNFDTTGQGTGTGFTVFGFSYNLQDDTISVNGWGSGSGYTSGDVIVIPGTSISYQGTPLVSPDNDVTITLTVNLGSIESFTVSGTLPRPPEQWPTNNVSDGGNDQYDTGNYINTNLAQQISYNNGQIVEDATAQFGPGSKYVIVYDNSIFGVFATGSSATLISTSGGSGADGNSTTDTGELFATDKTYDPALGNLTLTNNPLRAIPVTFTKVDNGNEIDIIIPDDGNGSGVGITRGVNNGIYNPYRESGWDQEISPNGTLWNLGNTDDLSDISSRTYLPFYAAYDGQLGNRVPGSTAIMYVPDNNNYYLIEWQSWTQGGNGGGFSYIRTEIDVTQVEQGLRFSDGTVLTSAEGLGRVKSTAVGNRRIEEVAGYKEVSVTTREVITLTTTASRSVVNSNNFWVDSTQTTIDEIINGDAIYQVNEDAPSQFSLDNITWYDANGGYSSDGNERGFNTFNTSVTYNQGDTIYFRYTGGGIAQTWWNSSELPAGSSGFRGAVIDYHAYTGDGTIIGTIHIVDDAGNENITHTEVSSGGTGSENDDLWIVTSEGRIRYRRLDGAAKTLKIHWTAKVFYGSEFYD